MLSCLGVIHYGGTCVIPETPGEIQCFPVLGNVDDLIGNSLALQSLVGRYTLHTVRLAIYGYQLYPNFYGACGGDLTSPFSETILRFQKAYTLARLPLVAVGERCFRIPSWRYLG